MFSPNWRRIAREYDERFKRLAEELAHAQGQDRMLAVFDVSIQFSKIVRWDPESADLVEPTDQTVTFLEHLAEIIHRHSMQSMDCVSFSWAGLAETYNEVHQPAYPAGPEQAPIFIDFFVEIGAIQCAESGLYRVTGPGILLDIIESGRAAPDRSPSISDLTTTVMSLLPFAESFDAQGETHAAFWCREAARIMRQTLQDRIADESTTPT